MRSLNPSPESCRRNGVLGLGLVPDHVPATVNVKLSHGLNQYEVAVPSDSSFGHLKSIISQKFGLKPEMYKLLYRGEEKQDDENFQTAGVTNNSEVLLMEATAFEQKSPEEVQETNAISKGDAEVAEVRKEVDKLVQQVSAFQDVVNNGTKVDEKEIIYLSEVLMRQLLKLDGIEAEGEGKVQRKTEVRRIQGILEELDILKSRNSAPLSNTQKTTSATTQLEASNPGHESMRSVTTQWETFDPVCENVNPSFPIPSSSPYPTPHSVPPNVPSSSPYPIPHGVPSNVPSSSPYPTPHGVPSNVPSSSPYPPPHGVPSNMPSSSPYPTPHSAPGNVPSSSPYPPPHSVHSNMPSSSPYPTPYSVPSNVPSSIPSAEPYYLPSHIPYFVPPNMPYYIPSSQPYYVHSPGPYFSPSNVPYHVASNGPYYAPSAAPSSVPFPMSSSSTKITQNWEHFG